MKALKMNKKSNLTEGKLTNKKESITLSPTSSVANKFPPKKKDNKVITLLPAKYKILVYVIFSFSSFFMYSWLKEIIRFKYNISGSFFLILFIFFILYQLLLSIFKKKIDTTSIVKVNILYSLCLSILSCYAFYYFIDLGMSCHATPTQILRHGYPKCYDRVKELYKFYFIIYYNLFIIFQTTTTCIGLLFAGNRCFPNGRKHVYSYLSILVFITIIIAFIYYIFTSI